MRLVWDEGHARGRLRWRSAERRLPAGVEVVSYRSAGSSLERVVRFGRPVKLGLVQVSYLKASRAWWLNGKPWRWKVGVVWRGDRYAMSLRPRWPFESFNHSARARMDEAERNQPDWEFE